MTYRKSRSLTIVALLLALAAPVAQAESLVRDTGVGRDIAEQGNVALRIIRAQIKVALQFAAPSLQGVRTRKDEMPAMTVADGSGTTFCPTTTVRAAE
jgi:hypothetical protein